MDIVFSQILTQIVGFLLLLWLLRRFAWEPLLKMLDDRREKIAAEFSAMKASEEKLATLQRDYETKLAEIEKEARQKFQEAMAEGEQVARGIIGAARKEAENILAKAREDIHRDIAAARVALRHETAELAIAIAKKVLQKEIDAQKNQQLVLQYMDALQASERSEQNLLRG